MPPAKKKSGRKATQNSATATEIRRRQAEQRQKLAAGRLQLLSVILFALAVFLLCVVFIPGQNAWAVMHRYMLGLFGFCAWAWPVMLGVVAVMAAMDKVYGRLGVKIAQASLLIAFVGAAIDIFSAHPQEQAFTAHLEAAFEAGAKGGGWLGALVGQPIYLLFGKTGAGITVCILIFVFFMLLTGTTLLALFRVLKKPVDRVEHAYKQRQTKQPPAGDRQPRFNVDIPVDDLPEPPPKEPEDIEQKSRRVVETYRESAEEIEAAASGVTLQAREAAKRAAADAPDSFLAQPLPEEREPIHIKDPTKLDSGIRVETGAQHYRYPGASLLEASSRERLGNVNQEMEATAVRLVDTLRSFGVETRVINISRGPAVTRYELQPAAGVKVNKITSLADDIALNLAAAGVRIEAPIPGKPAVGIEIPNKQSSIVRVREVIDSDIFGKSKSKLTVALGKDLAGNVMVADIGKMPHGLIAGATGSGKSVCINSFIISLLYKADPDEVKLLMIDPKVVELGNYNGIPHLLVPVVTDPRKASGALGWAVSEMEKRYKLFAEHNVRDLKGYNKIAQANAEMLKMPHIVIIIDELADLMMVAKNEVEDSICRIAQKARAAGMHLLVATQRPSVDVVTGLIKANIPTRIAFAVSSQIDSRTILDMGGAEKLLGRGDMLFYPVGSVKPKRVQGCFVSDAEIERVIDFVKQGQTNEYDENIMYEIEQQAAKEKHEKSGSTEDAPGDDPVLQQAIEVVVDAGQASTSLLQRRLKLGYARAARIVDEMEARGVVGPYEGSKPRKVLLTKAQLLEQQAREP